jgi:hypothetical protein
MVAGVPTEGHFNMLINTANSGDYAIIAATAAAIPRVNISQMDSLTRTIEAADPKTPLFLIHINSYN